MEGHEKTIVEFFSLEELAAKFKDQLCLDKWHGLYLKGDCLRSIDLNYFDYLGKEHLLFKCYVDAKHFPNWAVKQHKGF